MCKDLSHLNIGLDVDGPLANFSSHFIARARALGLGERFPSCSEEIKQWMFCSQEDYNTVWDTVKNDEQFWLTIPPVVVSQEFFKNDSCFKPAAYVTHRPVRSNVTARWLNLNGFPPATVISVSDPVNKLLQLRMSKVNLFVDDRVDTVRNLRDGGINAVLYKMSHQQAEDISGLPVISDLSELCDMFGKILEID
jgi:hypothetical protein